MIKIDLNTNIPGTVNFYWKEALWVPKWKIHVYPTNIQIKNIMQLAYPLQLIRGFLGRAIITISWLRPDVYNEQLKSIWGYDTASESAHKTGEACDFYVKGYEGPGGCDLVRRRLEPELSYFDIRLERNPGSNWVHIDVKQPGKTGRYFIP